ncbi:MAG: hypothetical protein HY720_18865 [Planctomycetes bacterium]|nr:hypothetical protein [Planctomycetota bacterium]
MARTSEEKVAMLTVLTVVLAAIAFTYFGTELRLQTFQVDRMGYAAAAFVVSLGTGLVVTRALADAAPRPGGGGLPPFDAPLARRTLGLAATVIAAGVVSITTERFSVPKPEFAAPIWGLLAGAAAVLSILALRRVYPPRPAEPVLETVSGIFGPLLDPAQVEVLHELVEEGEVDPEDLPNAGYDEVARWLATRGHALPGDKQEWEKRADSERRKRMSRGEGAGRHEGHPQVSPTRMPGHQKRGAR